MTCKGSEPYVKGSGPSVPTPPAKPEPAWGAVLLVALVFALGLACAPKPAHAEPCADLAYALAVAPAGAVVPVTAAAPCNVVVKRSLTLRGQPGASVRSVVIAGTGITVEDLAVDFTPDAYTVSSTPAVRIAAKSSGIALRRLTITGGLAIAGLPEDTATTVSRAAAGDSIIGRPIGRGVSIEASQDVTLEGVRIRSFHKGVTLNSVGGLTIRGCDIGDTRTGTISGVVTGKARIEDNRLHDSHPWKWGVVNGDHADFIHFWNVVGGAVVDDVAIVGNLLDQGDGAPILGVYLDNMNTQGPGFTNVRIEGNTILLGNLQGVRLERANAVVSRNLMLQASGDLKDAPTLIAADGSVFALTDNRLADPRGLLGAAVANEVVAPGVQPPEALDLARWAAARGR